MKRTLYLRVGAKAQCSAFSSGFSFGTKNEPNCFSKSLSVCCITPHDLMEFDA